LPRDVRVEVADPQRFAAFRGLEGMPGSRLVHQSRYDAVGNRVAEIDLHGNQTDQVLDSLYRLVKVQHPSVRGARPDAAAVSYQTTLRYDLAGNKVLETDGNGHSKQSTYDHANRLLSRTDGAGRFERKSYDAVGNVVQEQAGAGTEPAHLVR